MKKILIGTNNPSKYHVFTDYLDGLGLELVSPAELGLTDIPAESTKSAAGNALEKARAWYHASGLPVVTEDSGLVFVDLPADHPDQPGVFVRRASGHYMNDDEMLEYYSAIIHRHGGKLRAAWEDAWCICKDDEHYALHADSPDTLMHHARLMVDKPCATRLPGWPLDSLTFYPALNKYKAEMTIEEMHAATDALGTIAQTERQHLIDWLRDNVKKMI